MMYHLLRVGDVDLELVIPPATGMEFTWQWEAEGTALQAKTPCSRSGGIGDHHSISARRNVHGWMWNGYIECGSR